MSAAPPTHDRRRAVLHEMEARLLLSADLLPVLDNIDTGPDEPQVLLLEDAGTDPSAFEADAETSLTEQLLTRHELVVVDSATPDYQTLVDDILEPGDGSTYYEVVVLEAGADGLSALSDLLSGRQGLDALHVVSHGEDGAIRLGDSRIDAGTLLGAEDAVRGWGAAFTADADILLYGCDLAASDAGREFVDGLARLTGADVAASDDLTGATARGGDWLLEYQAGVIETGVAVSTQSQQTFEGVLLSTTFQEGIAGYASTQDTGVRSEDPGNSFGGNQIIDVDTSSGGGVHQALIRFDDLFGSGAGQIAYGSTITSATLSVDVSDPSAAGANIRLHRMLVDWNEGTSWDDLGAGPTSGVDYAAGADSTLPSPDTTGLHTWGGLTATLQNWSDGGTNYGWAIITDNGDGLDFHSSNFTTASQRPLLTVTYNAAPVAVDDGYTTDENTVLDSTSTWADTDWQYRRLVSFDNAARAENLTEFPVLVQLDAASFDYAKTDDQGQDLRFYDADGTSLAHDIESWDESGTSFVWVKVPQIDASSGTDYLHMYYGNTGVADGQDAATVWSDYRAVYHLDEDPGAGGTVVDTAGSFDANNAGSTDTLGHIGNAQDFDGSQHIDLGDDRPWIDSATAATFSIWMNTDTLAGGGDLIGVTRNDPADTGSSRFALIRSGSNIGLIARSTDGISDSTTVVTSTNPLSVGEWHHVTGTVDYAADTNNIKIYVDGQIEGTFSYDFTNNAIPGTNSTHATIGSDEDGVSGFFDGRLDEARIATQLRSADWISAQHASMTGSLVSIGSEQTVAGVVGNDIDIDLDTLTVTHVNGNAAAIGSPIVLPSGASLTMNGNGTFQWNPNAVYQSLDVGDDAFDTFTYTADDGNGNTDTATVTITVQGREDAPVFGGDDTGNVTEDVDPDVDTLLETAGNLTIADPDTGESTFVAGNLAGTYGTLTIGTGGAWTYAADNTQGAIQALPAGSTLTDTIAVTSADGTTKDVVITINGADDAPVFGGDDTGNVTEDVDPDVDTLLETAGNLTIADTDTSESTFVAGNLAGTYGTLTIGTGGAWTYEADNTQGAIQALRAGSTLTDTITVTSADGTTKDVVITLNGADDAPVFGGDDTGNVTEDVDPDVDTLLETAGNLTIADPDNGESTFVAGNLAGTYGTLSIATGGAWTYEADNTQGAIQALPAGSTLTDTITVTSADGSTHDVVITINGADDAPVFGGDDTGNVTEDVDPDVDTLLETAGNLTIADPDTGESTFVAGNLAGTFGTLSIAAGGAWTYEADNTQGAIQALPAGSTLTDTITVTSADGTTKDVVITINGADDGPVFGGDDTGNVTEDVDPDVDTLLETAGNLTIADPDTGESTFVAGNLAGTYGTLAINTAGAWTYEADNTQGAIQALPAGSTLTDTITVTSADGSTHDVVITINGADDAPVFGGDDTGNVTEDVDPDVDTLLETAGNLTIADTDTGESAFVAGNLAGTYGTLTIDTAGAWTYAADNTQGAIQALPAGSTLTDTITATSADGSTHDVVITINGADDAPVFGGDDTGNVTEDVDPDLDTLLETAGNLTIADTDTGESAFVAGNLAGTYGTLTIGTGGTWTYEADNTQGAIQALPAGSTLTDTIAVTSADGTTKDVVITINGADDAPVFGGDDTGNVTEDVDPDIDTLLETAGNLTIADTDTGESTFVAGNLAGTYGTLSIATGGAWTYAADNTQGAIQALPAGSTLTDTITVTSADGSTHDVVITINGADDAPVFGGDDTGNVTADVDPDVDGLLETAGNLTISDTDTGESVFVAGNLAGTYGTLTINTTGAWAYEADNTQIAVQALAAGSSLTDTITVTSADGSTKDVVITINGADGAPVFGGDDTGNVTEDVDPDVDTLLETAGNLTIADPDTGESTFVAGNVAGTYGTLTIGTGGAWTYEADNTQGAIQALPAGVTLTDTITVTSADGSTHDVVITINGADDAPVFGGDDTGNVTEDVDPDVDTLLETAGNLTITDPDTGESTLVAGNLAGTYGTLTIGTGGAWTYEADNTQGAIQALPAGSTLTDTITVTSADGTTKDVVITINGADDAPVFGGDDTGNVTEDVDPDVDTLLETAGNLTIADTDTGESTFVAGNLAGTYGTLTVSTAGAWTYTADNTQGAIQALPAGSTLTDTITVTSADGSTKDVVITINGADDAPVFGGDDSGNVTEDIDPDVDTLLETAGNLTIADTDTGESTFVAGNLAGTYGTLSIATGGAWTYAADNTQGAIQALPAGSTLTDTIAVTSADGTTKDVVITINGADDAPVFGGDDTGNVTEDVDPDLDTLLETAGNLTIADTDTGESTFVAGNLAGTYGTLTIGTGGAWTYEADNTQSAIQALPAGSTLTDTITATSADGSTHDVVITINGADDAPVFGGDDNGTVIKDVDPDSDGLLETAGNLTIADTDTGESAFVAGNLAGTYGTLTIGTGGAWTYEADNTQPAIAGLAAGATLTDTIAVTSADGSTHNVVITVSGANVNPTTSGIADVNVAEDAASVAVDLFAAFDDVEDADSGMVYTVTGNTDPSLFSSLTVDAVGGQLVLDFAADANGTARVTLRATDSGGLLVETTFDVNVLAANDTPVLAAGGPLSASAGASIGIGSDVLLASDVEDAAAALRYTLTAAPAQGSLLLDGSALSAGGTFTQADVNAGRVRYAAGAGAPGGNDTFQVQLADSMAAGPAPVSITVSVSAPPPPPVEPPSPEPPPPESEPPPEPAPRTEPGPPPATSDVGDQGDTFESAGDGSAQDVAAIVLEEDGDSERASPDEAAKDSVGRADRAQDIRVGRAAGAAEITLVAGPDAPQDGVATSIAKQLLGALIGVPAAELVQADLRQLGAALDSVFEQMDEKAIESISEQQFLIRSAAGLTVSLSVGYVLWVLQAGSLLAGFMTTMPLWRGFDPLPVMASTGPGLQDDEQAVRKIFSDDKAGSKSGARSS